MKRLKRLSTLLIAVALVSACVTINIYFPASQAEEAAEKIVDDILGKPLPKEGDKGAARATETLFLAAAGTLLDLAVPRAEAAQPDFNADTPEIRRIQAQMKDRHQDLAPFYGAGAIGFDRDARVAIRDQQAVSLKDRNRLKQLVDAENRDRGALYAAIARANGHPEWEPQVRETFAGTWVKKASKGWWYQDASGRWRQK
jgi:hypothetical protein